LIGLFRFSVLQLYCANFGSFSLSKTPFPRLKAWKLHSNQRCQSQNCWFSHFGNVEKLKKL